MSTGGLVSITIVVVHLSPTSVPIGSIVSCL